MTIFLFIITLKTYNKQRNNILIHYQLFLLLKIKLKIKFSLVSCEMSFWVLRIKLFQCLEPDRIKISQNLIDLVSQLGKLENFSVICIGMNLILCFMHVCLYLLKFIEFQFYLRVQEANKFLIRHFKNHLETRAFLLMLSNQVLVDVCLAIDTKSVWFLWFPVGLVVAHPLFVMSHLIRGI